MHRLKHFVFLVEPTMNEGRIPGIKSVEMEWSFVEKGVILPHKLAAHRLRADGFHDHSGFQPCQYVADFNLNLSVSSETLIPHSNFFYVESSEIVGQNFSDKHGFLIVYNTWKGFDEFFSGFLSGFHTGFFPIPA